MPIPALPLSHSARSPFGCAVVVWLLAGCNLFASAVPCHSDENCAAGERCSGSQCVPGGVPATEDGGAAQDGGPGDNDAGLLDGGPIAPACAPIVVVSAGAGSVPARHPLKLTLDHAALVSLGFAADGSDLRLLYDDGSGPLSLPRVLDPSSSWSAASTELWFSLAAPLEAFASTSAYTLRSRQAEPLLDDEGQVFPLADFVERPDSDVLEPPWSAPYAGAGVRSNGIEILAVDNGENRPFLDLALPALTSRFELALGFHFARTGEEAEYRVHLHLGDAAVMVEPLELPEHFARDGAAVSLVWSGPGEGLAADETLASDGVGGYTPLGVVSGERRLTLRVDPVADRYDVVVDGEEIVSTLPFRLASDVISRFRLVAWRVSSGISSRRLEYAFVRPLLEVEPSVSVELPADCQ